MSHQMYFHTLTALHTQYLNITNVDSLFKKTSTALLFIILYARWAGI